jgi:Uma2 family endonuclease
VVRAESAVERQVVDPEDVMSVAAPPGLLTAEDFARLPDRGRRAILVRGRVEETPMPPPKHGYYCVNIAAALFNHAKAHDLGRVMSNDSWVLTARGPDTVRGADVAFWSYARLPKGDLPDGVIEVAPDLVIEVRSPTERWNSVFGKVSEYLAAGVRVVCILDPRTETLSVYRDEELQVILTADDEMTLPDVLGDFRIQVGRFFE